ncbi:hypothetical protein AB0K19_34835, partial [Streptomyces klenkii]
FDGRDVTGDEGAGDRQDGRDDRVVGDPGSDFFDGRDVTGDEGAGDRQDGRDDRVVGDPGSDFLDGRDMTEDDWAEWNEDRQLKFDRMLEELRQLKGTGEEGPGNKQIGFDDRLTSAQSKSTT